jgi:hypothetical protein
MPRVIKIEADILAPTAIRCKDAHAAPNRLAPG